MLLFTGLVMVYSASIAIAEGGRFPTGHQPAYPGPPRDFSCASAWSPPPSPSRCRWPSGSAMRPGLFMVGVVPAGHRADSGIGRDVNGARRWISLGLANLQPSELMKLFAVLYAADYTVRKINVMHDLKQAFLPMFGAMAWSAACCSRSRTSGAFVVIISIAMGILFLGGLKARLFAMLIVGLLVAFAA